MRYVCFSSSGDCLQSVALEQAVLTDPVVELTLLGIWRMIVREGLQDILALT
jgi:hypothetical protein